ncbi:MAG TPA: dipeptidase [Candidatus Binatia bacterium]|nr:dipeptidase [Candidatus Binatia bacterium]
MMKQYADAAAGENEVLKQAREIHERVIVLDSHVDFSPEHLVGAPNYTERLDTQFSLPKMKQGGIDALFFIVYVGQTREVQNPEALKRPGYQRAYDAAVEKFEAVHRLVSEIAPEQIALALTPAELRNIRARGEKAAFIGVENGYPLGEDISRVQEFYERGARYLSLAHNGHNQLSDSHTGERGGWKWNGLSPLGAQVVVEMNNLGIMVDVSHASKESMLQTAALSIAPIIASHSAVRALCDVSRNLDDQQLLALKKTGGVVQIVAYGGFVKTPKPDSSDRVAALATLRREFNLPDPNDSRQRVSFRTKLSEMPGDQRAAYDEKLSAIDKKYPGDPPATLSDVVDHIDYVANLLGIDYVGIASDFDGGGGVTGWEDAGETFNVTLELVRRGYTEAQIEKLWGGNLLRVMEEVQGAGNR